MNTSTSDKKSSDPDPVREMDIHALIQQGRGSTLELLTEQAESQRIALCMAAMANSDGGHIVLGADADATLTGLHAPTEAIDRALQAALLLEPSLIIPFPQTLEVEGKTLVLVEIPAGMPRTYAFDGRYVHRVHTENQPLKPPELRRLFMQRGEVNFEIEIAQGTSLDDIDWTQVEHYARSLKGMAKDDPKQILLKRGCLAEKDGKLYPTHAGILLFGEDPQRYIRGAEVTAVRFAGEAMSDTFNRQDIIGTLPEQIRRVETFLVDHLRKGVRLKHTMERQEIYEYPMEAAREVVVNAVAHRDYSISGDGIRMFLFKDRMEVNSPGKLAGPVTVDNIKDERFSRNPAIVQVLSDMGFIERLGYGIDRVIDLMRQRDLRDPEFTETKGGFKVLLYNNANDPAYTLPTEGEGGYKSATHPEARPIPGELPKAYQNRDLNPRQESAIIYLASMENSRITNSDLQALFPDVHPETTRRDLADLVTKDILVKRGQKRGSYYVLKRDANGNDIHHPAEDDAQ